MTDLPELTDMTEMKDMTDLTDLPGLQERQLTLDFGASAENTLPGYRLHRVEVFNWGTFHQKIWRLNLDGKNALLTGDIGSGKSTLVDAITTLLIQRAAYNKAAGAETRERSLKSYALGYYKNERSEFTSSAKPVALRDNNEFSVILAVFHNAGYDSTTSIAQVFWTKDPSAPLGRIYICAERQLSIAEDFSNFRGDVAALRRKLTGSAEIYDSFKEYGAWFRRRLGIESEQALDLFHQTVSMKSVSNLTDFVRTHMLESFDVESRIKGLIQHFDALTSAHNAVLKAKRQVQLLTPLVQSCRRHAQVSAQRDNLKAAREALRLYFGRLKLNLLNERIESLSNDWARQDVATRQLEQRLDELRARESELRLLISANGGDAIEKLRSEIRTLELESKRRRETAERYQSLIDVLDESLPADSDQFCLQQQLLSKRKAAAAERESLVENELTEFEVDIRQNQAQMNELSSEIADLKSRRSNIPSDQIRIRKMLCEGLQIDPTAMPFAGELLQVHDDERDWEGAAERLLRGFGLSILVPDKYYDDVSAWVDRNHLKGRIVYFRVRPKTGPTTDLHPQSLVKKISIKPDTSFYDWLERELAHRFDFACCDSRDEFKRETKAITAAGQIKKPGEQHEKDDRSRIDDRSRFVLGWTNEAKIATLEKQAAQLEATIQTVKEKAGRLDRERGDLKDLIRICDRLEEYRDFTALDWQSTLAQMTKLRKEIEQLEATSDVLKQLNDQLTAAQSEVKSTEESARAALASRSKIEGQKEQAERDREDLQQNVLQELPDAQILAGLDVLKDLRREVLGDQKVTLANCDASERTTREFVQNRIDSENKKLDRLNEAIVQAMAEYNKDYPLETQEVDASVESAADYERMLAQLEADDLPRFEAKFKQLLNENTINEVANFRSQLDRQRELIKERIEQINQSLTKVPYNEGRYIKLEAQVSNDADIRDFQTQLRSCTEGAITGSEDAQYSESKFLQVKQVVERFRGREGQSELDKKWTARVSDVRNWFTFAASERWTEDDSEYEHYSDSSGKSGGQKEKLAYTILAASLAYQFGLEWGASRSRAFRFVVIDEAFGRGSDESAQYGLKLFQELNLQLLVVTPLQKIHIIEPYVASVGFVQNERGNYSRIRNLTISEYREKKAEILGL